MSEMLFPADYADARARFRKLASEKGFSLESFAHPSRRAPDGGELVCDVARKGAAAAKRILILSSGTHGVEGFCGSRCQAELLVSGMLDGWAEDCAVVLVHAINPYGFAWLRRTNEDNIDLNRNFIDHRSHPDNPAYDEIHGWLIPEDWDGPAREAAEGAIAAYITQRSLRAFQSALTGGQYDHPDGMFYGGRAPAWSNLLWRDILQRHCAAAEIVAAVDIHTGLGPRGVGEALSVTSEAAYLRAKRLFGDDVTWTGGGDAVSAQVGGSLMHASYDELGEDRLVMIALEFGTHPIPVTLEALRAENWLEARGDPASTQASAIKQALKDAFYIDAPDWQRDVSARTLEIVSKVKANFA
jgi:hypothetical protein